MNESGVKNPFSLNIVFCEYNVQNYEIHSIVNEAKSLTLHYESPNTLPIVLLNPGHLFSSLSPFNNSASSKYIESHRVLQEYINYAISIQPCVLVIENIDKVIPSEGTTRYRNNPELYEKHAKVCGYLKSKLLSDLMIFLIGE